ncbi:DUF6585 family protein [Corallococcus terminator]|uniref:Uncharacterized protein n=1 Tax=Corallococcus terminator TaxID=2316733 RepID=A0A3A8J368_9BACT|nr:DUF6585 family protein [Corallococcus terminator]RKG85001.1 hypothetical protein D7V88_20795 [Corallococcus terminator]
MKRSHSLVFPTPVLFWFFAGLVLSYLVVAALLAPAGVHLLPLDMVMGLLRSNMGFFILLFGLPCGIYLIGWRASDLFVWMRAPHSLSLDDQGLRAGDVRIAWRDVESVLEIQNHDRIVLRHRGGSYKLRLNLWSDAEALHQGVMEHVVPELLERVSREVAEGQAVRFGPLTLDDAGLTHKGRLLRWEDIESIRVQDEFDTGVSTRELVIVAQGKPRKIDEAKIPNAPVLLAYLSDRLAG